MRRWKIIFWSELGRKAQLSLESVVLFSPGIKKSIWVYDPVHPPASPFSLLYAYEPYQFPLLQKSEPKQRASPSPPHSNGNAWAGAINACKPLLLCWEGKGGTGGKPGLWLSPIRKGTSISAFPLSEQPGISRHDLVYTTLWLQARLNSKTN